MDHKDLEYRIGKLELKPGDVLVVQGATADLVVDSASSMIRRLSETIGCPVLLLAPGVDLSVLTAEEIAARTTKPT